MLIIGAEELKNNILETIGNTPLVRLNNISKSFKADIYAKLEFMNPGGSIKDRIGLKMLADAESKGLIKKGATIIEPTAGNTGVGLALVAALKGYKMIFIMPDKVSKDKQLLLKAYGAEIILTPTNVGPDDPQNYIKVAEKIVSETPNSFIPHQYNNVNNPKAHYESTGPEIWHATNGKVTHFVAGIGTGGTISGVAKFLKEKNPKIKVIGVDPEGSIYHHKFYNTSGNIHSYKVEGVGEDFIPKTVDLDLLDDITVVEDKDAFLTARKLAKQEGLLAGGSAGAAVYAAMKLADKIGNEGVIVVLLPDTGRNYLSTIFNDEWMKQHNFL